MLLLVLRDSNASEPKSAAKHHQDIKLARVFDFHLDPQPHVLSPSLSFVSLSMTLSLRLSQF